MPKKSSRPKQTRATSVAFDMRTILSAALITILVLIVSYFMGWRLYLDSTSQLRVAKETNISGDLIFTALKPEPEDQGEVKMYVRQLGTAQWQDTGLVIPLEDRARWTWPKGLPAVNYEFQAILLMEGEEIDRSDIQPVTAPASNVEMALNITWHDLPADVARPETTVLAGTAFINGYVPDFTQLEIYSIPRDDAYEVEAVTLDLLRRSEIIASIGFPEAVTAWSWDQADPEETYEVVAVLRNRGQIIGVSLEQDTADAGEKMVDFTINSTAAAPNQTSAAPDDSALALGSAGGRVLGTTTGNSSISGIVTIQGPEQEGTSLLMLWKNPSDANYQVVNRYPYPSQAGTAWTWGGATAGQPYQITAALQVNNNNSSTAPTPLTVTAPANNVNFTLNTWYVIPSTSGTPVFQTCLNRSGNSWQAQISIPPIQGAQQYWVQVGTTANSGNVWNQQFSAGANNQNFIVKVPATENQQQFVQYSYATCDQCQGDDNFAPFSTSVGFTCI